MKTRFAAGIALIAALLAPPLAAQEPAPPSPPQASQPAGGRKTPAPVPLKVTVVLSRFQGEKRISSMPYVLGVMASGWGPGPKTTLRMGVEVPVAQTRIHQRRRQDQGRSAATATATSAPTSTAARHSTKPVPGIFQLALTVSDSSVGLDTPKGAAATAVVRTCRRSATSTPRSPRCCATARRCSTRRRPIRSRARS